MENIEEADLSSICELILRDDICTLENDTWRNYLNETTEIPVHLIKLHVLNVKVVCSIQGEDQRLPLLHVAAAANGIKSIKHFLDMGFQIDCQTSFTKSTALHYASLNDNFDCVEYLLDQNCDVNMRTEFYDNQNADCDMCDANSNLVVICDTNQTAIMHSVNHQDYESISNETDDMDNKSSNEEVLRSKEPEQLSMTGGATALVLGASNPRIVSELLRRGAKLDPICEFDRGAMHITALGAAINAAAPESVKLLVEGGSSLQDICEFNHSHSALDMAICCCKYPLDSEYAQNMFRLVDLLISYGADPNIVTHDKTLLQNLVSADRSVDIAMMKKLYEAGADFERRCRPDGHTVLSLAILHGKSEQVKLLLNYNCSLNYPIRLAKNDRILSGENVILTPIEFSMFLCEKDVEWATSVRSWDPSFFLFLTRQLSIAELLLTCGLKVPLELSSNLKQFEKKLKECRHSDRTEVKDLCGRIRELLHRIANPQRLQDIATNVIRISLKGRFYNSNIYKLGLPKNLVNRCIVERLDCIPLPQRLFVTNPT